MNNRLTVPQGLDAVVTVGLTCVDQGIDTRENVKTAIIGYVGKNYVGADMLHALGQMPVTELEFIYNTTGLAFEANDGKLGRLVAEAAATAQGA